MLGYATSGTSAVTNRPDVFYAQWHWPPFHSISISGGGETVIVSAGPWVSGQVLCTMPSCISDMSS